ncbi:MAG: hypothetical protein H6907_04175 [Hyphomicrobiales bacterium]|nr:hypothetical protein [Hyphomicrobiales bacterium]
MDSKRVTFGLFTMDVPAGWEFRDAGDGSWIWLAPGGLPAVRIGQDIHGDLDLDAVVAREKEVLHGMPAPVSAERGDHPEGAMVRGEHPGEAAGTAVAVLHRHAVLDRGDLRAVMRCVFMVPQDMRGDPETADLIELFDRQLRTLSLTGADHDPDAPPLDGFALAAHILPGDLHICLPAAFEPRRSADGADGGAALVAPDWGMLLHLEAEKDPLYGDLAAQEGLEDVLAEAPTALAKSYMGALRRMYADRYGAAVAEADDPARLLFRTEYDDTSDDPPTRMLRIDRFLPQGEAMALVRLGMAAPAETAAGAGFPPLVATLEREVMAAWVPGPGDDPGYGGLSGAGRSPARRGGSGRRPSRPRRPWWRRLFGGRDR